MDKCPGRGFKSASLRAYLYRAGNLPLRFIDSGKTIELLYRYQVSVNEGSVLLAAALSGLGIIPTLRFMAKSYLQREELVSVLSDGQPPGEHMLLVYPLNRQLNARLRVFIEWAIARFE